MDLAQELELDALQLQKPMNSVIDQGDSPVQQFYDGATVFVTGGSGFIGKHLIEKLFRSCAIKKMFLLLRSKKGKTIQKRLQFILSDPVYNLLREKQPQFSDRIVAVEGDVADIKLGLSDEDWTTITQEVSVIFHAAATIRFDEPLRVATLINVRGTRDTLTLARACTNLKRLVHVSTAYSSATRDHIGKDVYERFYPSPISPELLISLAEELDEDRLHRITNNFIYGWPNTYTFTKAVAEEQIRATAKDLPICIVRPPIVTPAFYEPMPGWLDLSAAVSGTSGFYLATLLGVLNVFRVNKHTMVPVTPVDYVNNAIIAAGWDAEQRRNTGDTDIPIYTVSNKDHYLNWRNAGNHLRNNSELSTDKAVYVCGVVECESHVLYWVLSWLLHYIPAYILDAGCAVIGKKPAEIKSFVDIYKKMDKMTLLYDYFMSNYWSFHDDNVKAMLGRMSDADRVIYNCDVTTLNMPQYILIWGLGIRKYIIKDGINNTEFGYKKQKLFQVVNYVILSLYAYVLYCILIFSFDAGKYVLSLCFSES